MFLLFFVFFKETEAVTPIQVPNFVYQSWKRAWHYNWKLRMLKVRPLRGCLLGQLSAVLSAYTPAQNGFPLPFTFFPCRLQTIPASFCLHCSLEKPAPFTPPYLSHALLGCSFCLCNIPPQTSQISPHGLTTYLQPLQCNWLHKTYHWSKGLKKGMFACQKQAGTSWLVKKTAPLLNSLLPNKMFPSTFPFTVLPLSNLAYNTATVSCKIPIAGKTLLPPGIRQWRGRQFSLINHKGHLNSHVPAIPAHASHPNTTTAAYLEGFG